MEHNIQSCPRGEQPNIKDPDIPGSNGEGFAMQGQNTCDPFWKTKQFNTGYSFKMVETFQNVGI